ncbi:hypothetical protein FZEAL_6295 [Fusarium zealandicum]|uniref:Uncharacterized protein n=1 Tax=Fusarium zealandicum TaxID=1053134 RepID=A0A8H4UIK5_9HYPO|nr:hypothetical protein FZEAL_6295 [Fusarium zealandicum]
MTGNAQQHKTTRDKRDADHDMIDERKMSVSDHAIHASPVRGCFSSGIANGKARINIGDTDSDKLQAVEPPSSGDGNCSLGTS